MNDEEQGGGGAVGGDDDAMTDTMTKRAKARPFDGLSAMGDEAQKRLASFAGLRRRTAESVPGNSPQSQQQ